MFTDRTSSSPSPAPCLSLRNPASSYKEFSFPMIIEILLGGPVAILSRGKDLPVAEGQDVAGEVLFGLHLPGHEDLILVTDAHEPFIKRPVAKAAEGQAVS
jgi:hypothetical protein